MIDQMLVAPLSIYLLFISTVVALFTYEAIKYENVRKAILWAIGGGLFNACISLMLMFSIIYIGTSLHDLWNNLLPALFITLGVPTSIVLPPLILCCIAQYKNDKNRAKYIRTPKASDYL